VLLFRPEVIDAQRRRVFGSVTIHQPASLFAFTVFAAIVSVIGVSYLWLGTYARKETVEGWIVPEAGLSQVSTARGGLIALVAVRQGDQVRAGQTLAVLDLSGQGGAVWGNAFPVSSSLLSAPVAGRIVAVNARVGEQSTPSAPLFSISPENSPLEAQILVPTRAAGFVLKGQRVRIMVDSFPFQQFGAIQGEVREIARSALRPGEINTPIEFKEPVYRMHVTLSGADIKAYGENWALQPGMTLKADVITGRRTFMSWLLEPLLAARARAAAG